MIEVEKISLSEVINEYSCIDLLDMDIQGMEYEVVLEASRAIQQKVKYVYIESHSGELHSQIRKLFIGMKWKCIFDYDWRSENQTEYGKLVINDGIICFRNPLY